MQNTHPIQWHIEPFSELTTETLYKILQLRNEVFVCEQNCHYQDCDGLDLKATHIQGYIDGKLVAYARFMPPKYASDNVHVGRIIIAKQERGTGLGKQLIQKALLAVSKAHPKNTIELSAQHHLIKFYQCFGFTICSEPYDDAGILHIDMRLLPTL